MKRTSVNLVVSRVKKVAFWHLMSQCPWMHQQGVFKAVTAHTALAYDDVTFKVNVSCDGLPASNKFPL